MTKLVQLTAPFALAALSLATSAHAAPPRSATVDAAGLDLSGPAGLAELDARIAVAVRRVCGPQVVGNGVVGAGVRECRAATEAALQSRKLALIAVQRGAFLAGR